MAIHFESSQQKASSCELVVKLANDLLEYAGKLEQGQELRKLIIDLKKAALEAVPFAKVAAAEEDMPAIQEDEEEMQVDEENSNLVPDSQGALAV